MTGHARMHANVSTSASRETDGDSKSCRRGRCLGSAASRTHADEVDLERRVRARELPQGVVDAMGRHASMPLHAGVINRQWRNAAALVPTRIRLGAGMSPATIEALFARHLTHVTIQDKFNLPLPPMPRGVKKLIVKKHEFYNEPLDLTECITLTTLALNDWYNHPLDLTRHVALTRLRLGSYYNKPLDLTRNVALTTLDVGNVFKQPLDLTRNVALTTLILGMWYDQPLDLTRNVALKTLILGEWYRQPLDLTRNVALTTLELGYQYNQLVDLTANVALTKLILSDAYGGHVDVGPNCVVERKRTIGWL